MFAGSSELNRDHKLTLCDQIFACWNYGAVRRQCANASDIESCISAKMQPSDLALRDRCTDDGNVNNSPPNPPNVFECIFERLR